MYAALFDLDGVLIDSESQYSVFWHDMDRRYPTGIASFEEVIKGSTLPTILNKYFPDRIVQADICKRLAEFEHTMPLPVFPGILGLLKSLHAQGWRMAVVTSSNPAKLKSVSLQNPGFLDMFDTIVTDADVSRSKPDPQGYLIAASRLGCNACNCVVFEDSLNGLEAGRRSGAKVVAVATTNSRETVATYGDIIVDMTADVSVEVLNALFGL